MKEVHLIIAHIALWKLILVAMGAFVAGIMNATSGGGSFVTYPMLIALGEPTVVANATSTVGLWPGLVANLPGFKRELKSQKKLIKIFILPALFGGVAGSFILSHTPNSVFGFVAPILIFTGSLMLQFSDKIVHVFDKANLGTEKRRIIVVAFAVFFISIYAAYFGAGIGILFLAVFSILANENIVNSIAVKNVLALVANSVASLYFAFAGLVHWPISIAMGVGAIIGGITGSRVIHHIDKNLMRRYTVIFGLTISVILLIIRIA